MILLARSALTMRCGLLHKSKVMKLKLLLIEDEEDIAQALSRGLRKHGYAVDWARMAQRVGHYTKSINMI